MTNTTENTESYQHGHHSSVVSGHMARTAETDAAFLLPQLRPGVRLLDVGCGPGSITVGLARRVAPAPAIGIDPSPEVVRIAQDLALSLRVNNLSFETGDTYRTRFEDSSFDVVFAHQVLQHLSDPVRALKEIRRILVPDGVVAIREIDWGSTIFYPDSAGMRDFLRIYYQLAERHGGQPNAGRYMRSWFREAGFTDVTATTSTWSYCSKDACEAWGQQWADRTATSNFADRALEFDLATKEQLQIISDEWRNWGQHPDAFFCFTHCEIIAKST